ncbi:serine/threonine-protein kinase [Kibdelosporangium phytohabitans]|uniref:non-specific serine/threonine protein kinase n=1 Tax=Kibdelosporangium phytohabitans TaxID=860235 RepID=A0A0N9HHV7_9PSEU|nr:serine/threonine-protein kinase [Kibdelosporangium phytohabitans]ALG05548.1 serine/threonine protein kinase [Kibdelosporangium phytohabitans]MBE1466493.1 serine/threonine-protein kinase [Kibdelosporangium phytohabitans]
MLTSGQLLADRYRLVRRIAVGGMGEVWEASDTRLDRSVAVKVLKPELCGDAEFLHRFRTEARTMSSLNHPGIASVHDYGETAAIPDGPQDTAYLVMELVEGEPLATILAREGRINADRTLDILEQAGVALQAAHTSGYVHRDVKPGNIMITPAGVVKLTDFGIAKAADAAPVTRSGMVMGTAHYIAPEQALGQDAEPASDVYSLAVVGYECLMGHRPFLSENAVTVAMMHIRDIPPPLPPDVPPGARAVIEATLVKDPRKRYSDGGEFAAAVAAVRAGRPLPTPSGVAMAAAAHPVTHTGTHPGIAPSSMPPPMVHGTGSFPMPPRRPQRGARVWLWTVLALLLVALVVLVVWVLVPKLAGSSTPQPEAPARGPASATQAPPGVTFPPDEPAYGEPSGQGRPAVTQVKAGELLGHPASVVAERLREAGLQPDVRSLRLSGGAAQDLRTCYVTGVKPIGQVDHGSTVVVECDPGKQPPG